MSPVKGNQSNPQRDDGTTESTGNCSGDSKTHRTKAIVVNPKDLDLNTVTSTTQRVKARNLTQKNPNPRVRSKSPRRTSQATKPRPPSEKALLQPGDVPLGEGGGMDRDVVEVVEVQTRGQRENPSWFQWRKNRITASNAHRVAHSRFVNGKSNVPAASYLTAITGQGPSIQTRAMTWGIQKEAEAIRKYQGIKSRMLGHDISVQECGLFIDTQRPWLAASPDGIVVDKKTGQRLFCLEVKCPFKHRDNTVEQACLEDKTFCLEIDEGDEGKPPAYALKPGHSYYTQIQCQLAVTGLKHCDLVVFTLKETAIVPVEFDSDFWDVTLSKLEVFYKRGLLPYLRGQKDFPAAQPEK